MQGAKRRHNLKYNCSHVSVRLVRQVWVGSPQRHHGRRLGRDSSSRTSSGRIATLRAARGGLLCASCRSGGGGRGLCGGWHGGWRLYDTRRRLWHVFQGGGGDTEADGLVGGGAAGDAAQQRRQLQGNGEGQGSGQGRRRMLSAGRVSRLILYTLLQSLEPGTLCRAGASTSAAAPDTSTALLPSPAKFQQPLSLPPMLNPPRLLAPLSRRILTKAKDREHVEVIQEATFRSGTWGTVHSGECHAFTEPTSLSQTRPFSHRRQLVRRRRPLRRHLAVHQREVPYHGV